MYVLIYYHKLLEISLIIQLTTQLASIWVANLFVMVSTVFLTNNAQVGTVVLIIIFVMISSFLLIQLLILTIILITHLITILMVIALTMDRLTFAIMQIVMILLNAIAIIVIISLRLAFLWYIQILFPIIKVTLLTSAIAIIRVIKIYVMALLVLLILNAGAHTAMNISARIFQAQTILTPPMVPNQILQIINMIIKLLYMVSQVP